MKNSPYATTLTSMSCKPGQWYTALSAAAIALFLHGSIQAATLLAEDIFTDAGSGSYLYQYSDGPMDNKSTVILQIDSATNGFEGGWNYGPGGSTPPTETYQDSGTDYATHIEDTGNGSTLSVPTLQHLATQGSLIDGYYVFLLDPNESDSSINLETFDVYITDSDTISFSEISTSSPSLYTANNPNYSMDNGQDRCFTINEKQGASRWELAILIPEELLGTTDLSNKYVHIYTEFSDADNGAETVGYGGDDLGLPDQIPEPSNVMLLSLGMIITFLRRRRR